ncbi:MAG: pilus assembly protein CpaE [Chloroflexota bacterium]|jgi:Flp pilus assembly CpaE family ATPase/DNA-binding NarL/FixJ family response regulator|nr:pilus assembly protein CpaE [Chloroflexota bacterium]
MAAKIQVLIVDDISSTLDNLKKLLSFEDDIEVVATATNGREAVDTAKQVHPDVVLMDVNMPEMDGIQATELLATEAPASPVIIMSVQGERDYLRRAMQSGAREFLIKPFSGDELIASIRRVHQLEQRKENYNRSVAVVPGAADAPVAAPAPAPEAAAAEAPTQAAEVAPTPAPEAPAPPEVVPAPAEAVEASDPAEAAATDAPAAAAAEVVPAAAEEAPTTEAAPEAEPAAPEPTGPVMRTTPGELIVLYGGKGGVGKSVIATNLACGLAKEVGARVALVDLDLQFGDLGVLLNLPQSQSIIDVVENIDQADVQYITDIMAEGPAGVRVLTTAPSPELADLVTPDHVQRILTTLRTTYDFVVVDTSSHLGDITLSALDMASRILLITALSIPAVKNAKLALRLFETLNIPPQQITLVLNRCEAHTEFNKESIESHLKFPIAVQLPHDPRTVVNSINRGMPFVISNPEVEASQRIRQLVASLLPDRVGGEAPTPPARRGGLRFGRR